MDLEQFIPLNDKSILDRLENDGKDITTVGSYEDYLKLPLPECYLKRLENEKNKAIDKFLELQHEEFKISIKSQNKIEDGRESTHNS